MNVVLVMFRENGERRSFSLSRDVTVVGRREDADFRIPLTDVSRKHCRLIKDGNMLLVEDLGSANGTYHNGQRVDESELSPGDTLQVGPVQFVIQIDGVPSEEELMGHSGTSGLSQATHVAATTGMQGLAATPPPPLPPRDIVPEVDLPEPIDLPEAIVEDELGDLAELEPHSFEVSADSVAGEDDVVIDLGEPEKVEDE
jgi:pSer/pThr/pTyr-binding forkhead associated (FHA) protein